VAEDTKLCAKTRKIVVSAGLDISRVRIRVTRGVIHLQGMVKRLGEDPKDPESNMPFLEKLNRKLPKKWDTKLKKFVPDDDWLLWDLKKLEAGGTIEGIVSD